MTDIPGQVEQAVDGWFGDLVKSALTPIIERLLGELVLATPNLTGPVSHIWEITLGIADTVFVLFAMVGGLIVMTRDSIQTRYGLKEILPRLDVQVHRREHAACRSFGKVTHRRQRGHPRRVRNSGPLSGAGIGNQLLGYILTSIFLPDGVTQIFTVLVGLVLAVLALAVVFSFALRTAATAAVYVRSWPGSMLLCHALPGHRRDRPTVVGALRPRSLGIRVLLQATVLMLFLQVFFDPDSNVLGVPTASGIVDLLVCGALFVILLKIPNWVMRMVLGRSPRSTVSSLLRTAAMAAAGSAIGVPGVAGVGAGCSPACDRGGRASLPTLDPPRRAAQAVGAQAVVDEAGPGELRQRARTSGRGRAGGAVPALPKGARLDRRAAGAQRRADDPLRARCAWRLVAPAARLLWPSGARATSSPDAMLNRDGQITAQARPPRPDDAAGARQRPRTPWCPMAAGARFTRACRARERLEPRPPRRKTWHRRARTGPLAISDRGSRGCFPTAKAGPHPRTSRHAAAPRPARPHTQRRARPRPRDADSGTSRGVRRVPVQQPGLITHSGQPPPAPVHRRRSGGRFRACPAGSPARRPSGPGSASSFRSGWPPRRHRCANDPGPARPAYRDQREASDNRGPTRQRERTTKACQRRFRGERRPRNRRSSILGPFTARQSAILATAAAVRCGWSTPVCTAWCPRSSCWPPP